MWYSPEMYDATIYVYMVTVLFPVSLAAKVRAIGVFIAKNGKHRFALRRDLPIEVPDMPCKLTTRLEARQS